MKKIFEGRDINASLSNAVDGSSKMKMEFLVI